MFRRLLNNFSKLSSSYNLQRNLRSNQERFISRFYKYNLVDMRPKMNKIIIRQKSDDIKGAGKELASIKPQLAMIYTCKKCGRRSGKKFSRLAYEKGVVIVQCPGCEALHLVADHLNWFPQKGQSRNIKEILAERGVEMRNELDVKDFELLAEFDDDPVQDSGK